MENRGYKIYSYRGGNRATCTIGYFVEYLNIRDLLSINFLDIFFFPPTVSIPLPGDKKAKVFKNVTVRDRNISSI